MDKDKATEMLGSSEELTSQEEQEPNTKIDTEKSSPDAAITRLDSWSVHRICSGQVIISLAVAVKELVENALDAGAKEVVIRTREFGLKSIEVQDNGEGILPENYESLCLKHFTSKLREFSDLESIATFGFRGEALSSLCALGQVSVVTKHSSKEIGSTLRYNTEGLLVENKPCARETGTTVCVENIFSPLPVRHKQFVTTLKKEFTKMVHFMSGYGLIARGVSLSVVNFDDKGRRHEVLKKRAHIYYKDNIAEVFGYKEVSKLVEYAPASLPLDEEILEEFRLTKVNIEYFKEVRIEGFISSCTHGKGRSTGDRQFFFVNSRPCDHAKLTKLVNQVYHQYNNSQQPFVMLNILTPQPLVDVNLTPDKRTVLLHRENVMLAMIKASLVAMFNTQATRYSVNTIDSTMVPPPPPATFFQNRSLADAADCSFESKDSSVHDNSMSDFLDGDAGDESITRPYQESHDSDVRELRSSASRYKKDGKVHHSGAGTSATSSSAQGSIRDRFAFQSSSSKRKCQDTQLSSVSVRPKRSTGEQGGKPLSSFGFTRSLGRTEQADPNSVSEERSKRLATFLKGAQHCSKTKSNELDQSSLSKADQIPLEGPSMAEGTMLDLDTESAEEVSVPSKHGHAVSQSNDSKAVNTRTTQDTDEMTESDPELVSTISKQLLKDPPPLDNNTELILDDIVVSDDDAEPVTNDSVVGERGDDSNDDDKTFVDEISQRRVGICKLNWTMDELRQDFEALLREESSTTAAKACSTSDCRFRARISPKENTSAESELIREISKDMFEKMEIIGQFNKGFIVARMDKDLFIVDQHAADEKFNFETLQATTSIDCQPLAVPQKLSLAPGNEQTILEHMMIFEKNGFRIAIDDDAPWGHRLSLNAVPVSGQWQMGMAEVDELIFMLNDNSHPNLVNCRPAKVRSMFAMRACRRSVMVGDELSLRDMKRVVGQLSGLQHPWNCPHGRPTMRHLVNLSLINV